MAVEEQRPIIMGILNITPDSFSDGGDYFNEDRAIKHALEMVNAGARILDIGGESTSPGSQRVSTEKQLARVLPALERLQEILPQHIQISIDTTLSEVAEAAVEAGAEIINDISAGEDDPEMFDLAASNKTPLILMHKQGSPKMMQTNPAYVNVVEEVKEYLLQRVSIAIAKGVDKNKIILDPGFGFGKTLQHNLQLMAGLEKFVKTGYEVLLGTSRKTFLSKLCNTEIRKDLLGATCATTVMGVEAGVKIFRVHDVKENRQAADLAFILKNASFS